MDKNKQKWEKRRKSKICKLRPGSIYKIFQFFHTHKTQRSQVDLWQVNYELLLFSVNFKILGFLLDKSTDGFVEMENRAVWVTLRFKCHIQVYIVRCLIDRYHLQIVLMCMVVCSFSKCFWTMHSSPTQLLDWHQYWQRQKRIELL